MENLLVAAETDNLDKVKELLKDPNIKLNFTNAYNVSALTVAVIKKRIDVVKFLLEQKDIDLHIQGYLSGTPLTYAVFSNQNDLAKLLLAKEEKIIASEHPSALNWAILNGQMELIQLFNEKGADFNLPGLTGYNKSQKWVWKPMPHPISTPFHPDHSQKIGHTPLYLAIYLNNQEIATYLLETCKANPNLKSVNGELPLQLALKSNNINMVKLLLAYGANPNMPLQKEDESIPSYLRESEVEIDSEILAILSDAKNKDYDKHITHINNYEFFKSSTGIKSDDNSNDISNAETELLNLIDYLRQDTKIWDALLKNPDLLDQAKERILPTRNVKPQS